MLREMLREAYPAGAEIQTRFLFWKWLEANGVGS
jgi:hypothetical protein